MLQASGVGFRGSGSKVYSLGFTVDLRVGRQSCFTWVLLVEG